MSLIDSLSRSSILAIANDDDIIATAGGPDKETGKFVGWITFGESRRYRPLVSTQPIFESSDLAVKAMEEIVAACKEAAPGIEASLSPLLTPEEAGIINSISAAARD